MRLISIDTETTGSSPAKGDRCVEIGAVELIDGRLTGRAFQTYLNPDRKVAWQAERVHGLSNRFLADKPRLAEIAPDLLDFIGGSPCLAHNARFDRDMLLYDFRHAELEVPDLRFFDTIPLAKAHVRAPAYRLDVLAQTLGLIDTARGLHGALEDATILARVIETIEARKPDAIGRWLDTNAPLSPLPKGWHPPPTVSPSGPVTQSVPGSTPEKMQENATPTVSEEQREVDRIAGAVRAALEEAPDLPLFAERLSAAGVLMRPVTNGELTLHGVRFSTRTASFTGGAIGLTGSALERAGPAYKHPEHEGLIARLVTEHDRVMGPVTALKGRFTAVPARAEPSQTEEARQRLRALIAEALPGARTVFDLAARLEAVGVHTVTRLDAGQMRVKSVLFVADGARVPGPAVGLGPRDQAPDLWSLTAPGPVRTGPDGRAIAPASRRPPAPVPERIGDLLNEGVAELISALNSGALEIGPETVLSIKSGTDGWSRLSEPALWEVIGRQEKPAQVEAAIALLSGKDRASALRWVCRGLRPDLSCAFHLTRAAVYEARNAEREQDLTPEP